MSKLTVAYIALAPFISGSERSLQATISQVSKMGVETLLICPEDSPLLDWANENNIRFESCGLKSLSADRYFLPSLYSQFRLCYLFIKYKINIVHSNQIWSYPTIYWPAKLNGCSIVCHLRDPIGEGINWWMKRVPDAVICVSQYLKSQFQQHYRLIEKVNSVDALINPVVIPPTSTNSQRKILRQQSCSLFNISSQNMIFGFIGQISPVKGVFEMLEVLSEINHSNWQLLIAGDDPSKDQAYLSKCKDLVVTLGIAKQVHFIGFQKDVSHFFYATDCILMFSKREPLGRVPLEAGAYYTPSIVNNIDGLPETLIDGKSGYLISLSDITHTVKTLLSISIEDSEKMGLEARIFVEKNTEVKLYCEKIIELYISLNEVK
ncbi:MAG: glycosyltransferase involved in cell wall biosynthesis [Paraglaciecola sp.]